MDVRSNRQVKAVRTFGFFSCSKGRHPIAFTRQFTNSSPPTPTPSNTPPKSKDVHPAHTPHSLLSSPFCRPHPSPTAIPDPTNPNPTHPTLTIHRKRVGSERLPSMRRTSTSPRPFEIRSLTAPSPLTSKPAPSKSAPSSQPRSPAVTPPRTSTARAGHTIAAGRPRARR